MFLCVYKFRGHMSAGDVFQILVNAVQQVKKDR